MNADRKLLELDKIVQKVVFLCEADRAKRLALEIEPSGDPDLVERPALRDRRGEDDDRAVRQRADGRRAVARRSAETGASFRHAFDRGAPARLIPPKRDPKRTSASSARSVRSSLPTKHTRPLFRRTHPGAAAQTRDRRMHRRPRHRRGLRVRRARPGPPQTASDRTQDHRERWTAC
ncbi:MAG: hypothetical protein MZU79_05790 [Anaerotruncus sp.]|nr:hypothetical protein [Anaerotruncus sp.]